MKLGSRHISKNTMRLLTPLGISLPLMAQAPGSSDGTAIGVSVASAMMLATGLSAAGYAYLKHRRVLTSAACLDCHNAEGPKKNVKKYLTTSRTCGY